MNHFQPTVISKGLRVASVSQGIIVYIRGSLEPQWNQLLEFWDWLVRRRFWTGAVFVKSSADMEWRRFDELGLGQLRTRLHRSAAYRPVWRFEAGAGSELSDRSFEVTNLQPTFGRERASHTMVRLPFEADAQDLLEITNRLAGALVFHSGTAGYMFDFVEAEKPLAFDQIWAWARRYWGPEVIDTQAASWDILQGIYGVNWLTLIGNDLLDSKLSGIDLLSQHHPGIELKPIRHGVIVQAGLKPVLEDMNRFEDVSAYVAASQLLEPAFLKEPSDFMGMFTDHKSTVAWIRRFIEPDLWLEPELG
jgi:hypothetical protein